MNFYSIVVSSLFFSRLNSGFNIQPNIYSSNRLNSKSPKRQHGTTRLASLYSNDEQDTSRQMHLAWSDDIEIPDGALKIGFSANITTTKPYLFNQNGLDLIIWRGINGDLHAFENRCPHRSPKLSLGELTQIENDDELGIKCPMHGFVYDTKGLCVHDPEENKSNPFVRLNKWSVYCLVGRWIKCSDCD